jgi:regulator of sirC expression with transglutaminase-like and TPR domain
VVYLRQILAGSARTERLDRAALELASIQFPDLEPEPFLTQLNELASRLGDRLRNFNDGRDFVEKAQRYLFEELGFHGNESDYFDPRNSCLNQVLERRTGIPITLSVMYMEIARRLHMPVYGIDLPRHFVLQFDDGNYSTFIDPFHGGKAISARECYALAEAPVADPILLQRTTKKRIAMRMLRNLQHVYLRMQDLERAATTLDLLLEGAPEIADWYKQRGMVELALKRFQHARRDFEKYLSLEPAAADREEVVRRLEEIHSWLGRLN